MRKFDVVAVGSGTIDLVFRVPRLPKNDDKVVGCKIAEMVGGTVANSACVMGKLGLRVTSLSTVGNDYYAQMIIDDFIKNNVDISYVQNKPGISANMAIILVDESGEKSLVYAPNDETETSMVLAEEAIRNAGAVYIMPSQPEKFRTVARYAREQGIKVIIDIESHIEGTGNNICEILSLSDIAFFNKEGFHKTIFKEPNPKVLQSLVEEYGLEVLIVTCGNEGVTACTIDTCVFLPAFQVPVVDTTGAGDTFNGAFIYSWLNHYPLADAITFASAAAAINISHTGARGAMSSRQDVEHFISNFNSQRKLNDD
ncbi:TPA: carbohydrate kinase family protein [Klebsiella variicola]|nr:carbohydrate kinase family protein [Klebsiella variicola]